MGVYFIQLVMDYHPYVIISDNPRGLVEPMDLVLDHFLEVEGYYLNSDCKMEVGKDFNIHEFIRKASGYGISLYITDFYD